jgi:hypothetical protein
VSVPFAFTRTVCYYFLLFVGQAKSFVNPLPKTNFGNVLQKTTVHSFFKEASYQASRWMPLMKTSLRGFKFIKEIWKNAKHVFGVLTVLCIHSPPFFF